MQQADVHASAILVVDDDEDVRDMITGVLEMQGFTVLQAGSGREAMALLRENPDVSLLFSDIRMPGMTGTELARQAREMRPELRVVLTTGFAREPIPADTPVIHKPFRVGDLIAIVRRAIE
jgi:CheY-like chemotaxis protein